MDAESVFLFGHSMGGMMAPFLAADDPVKGVAVYGTTSRSWFQTLLELRRRVMMFDGTAAADADRLVGRWDRLFRHLFMDKMNPAELANKHPDLRDLLKVMDGEGKYFWGRHYLFHHQIADRSVEGAWARVQSQVLTMWGKSDWSYTEDYSTRIARTVNLAHPGRATSVGLEGVDHTFFRIGSPEESFRLNFAPPWPEYNPVVLRTLRGWLAKASGKASQASKPSEGTGSLVPKGQTTEWEAGGKPVRRWTVLLYATAFGNDVRHLLKQVAEVKTNFVDHQGVEFIALLDRGGKYIGPETGVGEHFQGTRLYRITRGQAERLGGGAELPKIAEAGETKLRMGDAATLRQFVRYAKAHHRADRYALFLHGYGAIQCLRFDRGGGRDALFPAAISETLERKDSVDLLVLDVCNGAAIENAYQWRPGNGRFQTDVLVAAPGVGREPPYGRIVQRLAKAVGECRPAEAAVGLEPVTMTAREFGRIIIAEMEAHCREVSRRDPKVDYESLGCCDLSKAGDVKQAVDDLAVSLAETNGRQALEAVRGFGTKPVTLNYMWKGGNEIDWLTFPQFDLYDLARRVRAEDTFRPTVRASAGKVMTAVEAMIVSSFGQTRYKGFQPGRNGVYIVFPDGAALYDRKRHWAFFRWYNALDVRHLNKDSFGLYAWCKDGATSGNGVVENWFELLASWYDSTTDGTGGLNGYRW